MAELGSLSLLLALVLCLYAIAGFLVGEKTGNWRLVASSRGAVLAVWLTITVA